MRRERRRLAAIVAVDVAGYSRLVGDDEEGTLRALREHRLALIEPLLDEHGGRVANTAGDSLLLEFPSAVDAVRCATAVQHGMAERNKDIETDRRIRFRIGINVGDVISEGDDLLGNGVNLAARIETLAEPGGICLSEDAFRQVRRLLDIAVTDLGPRRVKNIDEPLRVYAIDLGDRDKTSVATEIQQEIRFCTASDGVELAYATAGEGYPLVKTATWMSHVEYDWQSPIWRHLLLELARSHRLVRYDERGNGLSDWEVDAFSFEACVGDLESVVDAVGLDRFVLFGLSQGCAISAAYAARHPERVSRLVLYGGYSRGWRKRGSAEEIAQEEALLSLARQGWGQNNPAFRQVFTSLFAPDATPEQMEWYNDLQRMTTSGENIIRIDRAFGDIDVTDLLGRVSAPTLVLHCREDAVAPFREGRRLAAMIPDAKFVALEGRNHLLLESEPAWKRFKDEVRSFLAGVRDAGEPG